MITENSVADLRAALVSRKLADLAVTDAEAVLAMHVRGVREAKEWVVAAKATQQSARQNVKEIEDAIEAGSTRYPLDEGRNGTPAPPTPNDGSESEPPAGGLVELQPLIDHDRAAAFADREKEEERRKRRERDARRRERQQASRDPQFLGGPLPGTTAVVGSSEAKRTDGSAALAIDGDGAEVLARRVADIDRQADDPDSSAALDRLEAAVDDFVAGGVQVPTTRGPKNPRKRPFGPISDAAANEIHRLHTSLSSAPTTTETSPAGQKPPDPIKCPSCGTVYPSGSIRCPGCGVGATPTPAVDDGTGLAPWTSADLDVELFRALTTDQLFAPENRYQPATAWAEIRAKGASNDDIRKALEVAWPDHVLTFEPPRTSGGKFGYTTRGGKLPAFWIGAYRGVKHKATLDGTGLISRVRDLLDLPMPSEARRRAREATRPAREPTIAATGSREARASSSDLVPSIPMPEGGWDSGSIANAADDLGVKVADAIRCKSCNEIRVRIHHPCPRCGSPEFVLASADERAAAALGRPERAPKKRGRQPRKGIPGVLTPE